MNNKEDLESLTFCIPIRIESEYRSRNLIALLKYLDKNFITNIIILEADIKPLFNISDLKMDNNIQYIFIEDEDPIFHRTKYINHMLRSAKTPYAAIWDTDAITPIKQIREAYLTLQRENAVIVFPFSGVFYGLDRAMSDIFVESIDIHKIHNSFIPKFIMYGFYCVGGAFMVNISQYMACGGENEHFYGWGLEDQERVIRSQILGMKIRNIEGPLYHLYHTRGHNSRIDSVENAIKVKSEFCKICGMTNTELTNYIKTWHWIK